MPFSRKAPTYECLRMPEVFDEMLDQNIPGVPQDARESFRFILGHLDGSGPKKGMTCIDRADTPTVQRAIFRGLDEKFFEYDPSLIYQKSLRGLMHDLDRSCYECARNDCENRVALSRVEIMEIIFFGKCRDYRHIKTDPRYAGTGFQLPDEDK